MLEDVSYANTFELPKYSYLTSSGSSSITTFVDLTSKTTFLQDFTAYCDFIANSSPKETFGGSAFNNTETEPDLQYFEVEIRRRHRRFPHLTRDEIAEIMMDCNGSSAQMDMSLALFDDMDNTPTDYSNLFEHQGRVLDVSKLEPREVIKLAREVEDINKFESLEHIRSMYIGTAPNVKLVYPEPFVASPSFILNDLGYLHILQYQFWLWFVFIFLIVFYFVSFLCVVRWCANRNQPRRETRGVSRSKCGDLITATVPITWAISIIVSETTDATDNYDGFGTGELIVGVRAYQWGWEYYYPKNVDLNYNLKPSYSTFTGNSLRYNTATERKVNANNVWKHYQQKNEDSVVTPAHLLVLPLDNSKLFNFMNFDNIGANALSGSNAFKKIREHSKVYKTNLVATPSTFADKYVKLTSLFVTENDLNNSFNYGLKRQHNLTSTAATANVQATFLDRQSMDKFLAYNLRYNRENHGTDSFVQDVNLVAKANYTQATNPSANNLQLLLDETNVYNTANLKLIALYPNLPKEVGGDSDKKTVRFPLRKLVNEGLSNRALNDEKFVSNAVVLDHQSSNTTSYDQTNLLNKSMTSKSFEIHDGFNKFRSDEQTARYYSYMTDLEPSSLKKVEDFTAEEVENLPVCVNKSKAFWAREAGFAKAAGARLSLDAGVSPIMSSNPHQAHIDFDRNATTNRETSHKRAVISEKIKTNKTDSALLLTGTDRETAMAQLSSSYWKMFWANTNPHLRIDTAFNASLNQETFYLPPFTNCYDYDFRNAQAVEMLEDAFWETAYSGYNHLDYINILDNAVQPVDEEALTFIADQLFYLENKRLDLSQRVLMKPTLNDLSSAGTFYANSIQMDDLISPANLMNTKDFALFPIVSNIMLTDDTYMSQKHLSAIFAKNSSILFNFNTLFNYPQSYLSVLNNFRADFDDFSWYVELLNKDSVKNLSANTTLLSESLLNSSKLNYNNSARYSNPVTLRSTAKNSIVTYAALQKVFRSRLEDGRSNVRLNHFSDLRVNQPFLMGNKVTFEKLLGKNKESFYNTSFYTNNSFSVLNDLASANSSLNTYFFDFPFLVSTLSDSAHFVWFDWYVRWSMVEVQPASAAKQSLAGVPYLRKGYEYSPNQAAPFIDSENYFTRISRARKNYMPLWVYTPYMYTRNKIWSPTSALHEIYTGKSIDTKTTLEILKTMAWYNTSLAYTKNTTEHFTPTFSNSHKSTWRPYQSIQAYHYNMSILTDILTRREYLFRQYLETNNKIINLPKSLSANPKNSLLTDIKASFLLLDPITYASESSRELFYHSVTGFRYFMVKEQLMSWSEMMSTKLKVSPLTIQKSLGLHNNGTDPLNNALLYYFFDANYQANKVLGNNGELYKSQYRPLKKGITNMLRLHGTGAVAMPIEIRLQILASSRDVIHSWAIPSAGIKIDCIPGYTSHRIMTFLTPGIYWGQCMEICGRYHHWMPIILYFMKRDLFFLWCTHFMSKSDFDSTWGINDRQFADYLRFVSYDRITWLTELGKNL
jgi:heme/copper-type cytochrome/quinol oxidase subunit 2